MDTIQMATGSDSSKAPEGHDEAMAQKFDEAQATARDVGQPEDTKAEAGDRPEGLPEKFKSWDDMVKSYNELESKLGKQPETDKAETKTDDEVSDADADGDSTFDLNSFAEEFAETGELSDESFEALEANGFPRSMVEEYIEGQRARGEVINNAIFTEAGGKEAYEEMINWAVDGNYSDEEIAAFDKAILTDGANRKVALDALKARFVEANGKDPSLVNGGNRVTAQGYESWAQVTEAMSDPRYKSDPAYRDEVTNKLAISELKS